MVIKSLPFDVTKPHCQNPHFFVLRILIDPRIIYIIY